MPFRCVLSSPYKHELITALDFTSNSLPPELAYQIIQCNCSDSKELSKYFLVSKVWRSIAISFLYHNAQMTIRSMKDVHHWQRKIIPSPEIAMYIHKVMYGPDVYTITPKPSQASNRCVRCQYYQARKHLEWTASYDGRKDAVWVYRFLQRMPALESVTFSGSFPGIRELNCFLVHCGPSNKLTFKSDFRLTSRREELGIGIQRITSSYRHCDLSLLEHLEIESFDFDLVNHIFEMIENSPMPPRLRTLAIKPTTRTLPVIRLLLERTAGVLESLIWTPDGTSLSPAIQEFKLFRKLSTAQMIPRLIIGTESNPFSCHSLYFSGLPQPIQFVRIANGNFVTVELVFSAYESDDIRKAINVERFWRTLVTVIISQNPEFEELVLRFHVAVDEETKLIEAYVKERLVNYGFRDDKRISVTWGKPISLTTAVNRLDLTVP
ncbi:hypothetical protein VNI00_000509 [Paramarasmius palmivorus]|uniref:F-box domain-containing protein n=1 Tax=Paramarasmius palmivorus TaxID=297713 RepID=A0AAW0E9G9_9AGAR